MSALQQQFSDAPAGDGGIDEASFKRLSSILHRECGIVLSESKKSLAVSRLSRRLRHLSLNDFATYCNVLESDENERREMIALLTTNVTQFFREAHHFDSLRDDIFPQLVEKARSGERVRIWSAGCSSGQEPYSIAMTLLELCPDAKRYDIKILATDIDPNMIRNGQEGVYRDVEKAQMPGDRLKKFFEKSPSDDSSWKVTGAPRELISFAELNLIGEWPMKGTFDVIFCRNVVIYFDADTQAKLWTRFSQILKPAGHLFVGHSERVSGPASSGLNLIGTTHYQKS